MQRNCTELTERLLKSLDKEYNVVDMGAVVDVITALEKTTITKEVLEITRLGKYINELRRKTTNDALAKRAKDLVRRWRDMVLPSSNQQQQQQQQQQHVSSNTAIAPPNAIIDNTSSHQTLNGTKPASPLITAARTIKPRSPVPGSAASRIKPQSPLMRDAITSKIISPALSLNSDSCSPNSTPIKLPIVTTNYKLNTAGSPKLSGTSNQNHSIEAVPRTHSSNKRLRKEDHLQQQQQQHVNSPHQYDVNSTSRDELTSISIQAAKKQRINGDLNVNTNSQVPNSPSSSSSTRNELNVNPVLEPSLSSNINLPAVKVEPVPVPVGPKKRGRKKGSKSIKSQSLSEDRVKEKLASISRNPKLKTTHEILADIQVRNVTGALGATTAGQLKREPPTTEEVLRSSEINNRNLASNNNTRTKNLSGNRFESRLPGGKNIVADVAGAGTDKVVADVADGVKTERASEPEAEAPSIEMTVKDILAKLPPLDLDAIRWSDDESNQDQDHDNDNDNDEGKDKYRQMDDSTVERLHNECIESLNGNFQVKLTTDSGEKEGVDDIDGSVNKKIIGVYKRRVVDDDTEREFREWHEMLARPSFDGQILHILPYVIID